jgi:hypothetical protein
MVRPPVKFPTGVTVAKKILIFLLIFGIFPYFSILVSSQNVRRGGDAFFAPSPRPISPETTEHMSGPHDENLKTAQLNILIRLLLLLLPMAFHLRASSS